MRKISKKKSSSEEKQPEKTDKKKRLINFLLSPKQEEMLDYNVKNLNLAKNRTDYFVNKITEDFKTQGKGYKKETPNDVATKKDIEDLKDTFFNKVELQLQAIQMMTQSIANHGDSLDKDQKLAKIEQQLFSYNGLAKLDTYEKLEGYLLQQFPDWESDLVDEKIYYDLVYKLLQEKEVKYNKRLKKFIWSVPD